MALQEGEVYRCPDEDCGRSVRWQQGRLSDRRRLGECPGCLDRTHTTPATPDPDPRPGIPRTKGMPLVLLLAPGQVLGPLANVGADAFAVAGETP